MNRNWLPLLHSAWTLALTLLALLVLLETSTLAHHIDYWLYNAITNTPENVTSLSRLAAPVGAQILPGPGWEALAGRDTALLVPLGVILILAGLLPTLQPERTVTLCAGLVLAILALHLSLLTFGELWMPVSSALLMPPIALAIWSSRRLALTNRFLSQQLNQLTRGHQFQLQAPATRHPRQLLDDLRSLLQASGWWLSRNGEPLEHHRLTDVEIPPNQVTGQWFHRDNQSWLQLQRNQDLYQLGLELPQGLMRDAAQRYLQRLSLDHNGGMTQLARMQENISARIEQVRIATERINQTQSFVGRSFENMPDGIIVTDAVGVIQFVNGHIQEWFGEPRPGLIGMPLARLFQGHDPRDTPPWPETISETLTLQQSRTVDLQIRGMDFLVHFAPFALPESQQNGIIANISNISELREQQRQHREAIDFISHDVRSPLVSQLALIEQLKRRPGEILPDQLDQLGRLARRSYQLAEEFVQLARAEQLTETRFYECELLTIVENARDSVIEQAAEKQIRLQLAGKEDLWLNGNAELLERAVINLLTNAVQYSRPNTIVTIQVFRAGHQACLSISDEGEGIAENELPHLFDRYRRQKSSELAGNYGAGLGLSFVSVVMEKHRGEIQVTSQEGVGSAFTIRLPVANPLGSEQG